MVLNREKEYLHNLQMYLLRNSNNNEIDFLNSEILRYKEKIENFESEDEIRKEIISTVNVDYFANDVDFNDYVEHKLSNRLKPKESLNGYVRFYELKLQAKRSKGESSIDLSDSKANEKIIFLKQLGIIDFLVNKEPFNTSTNSLASAISSFTGVKQSTVQSYINPIIRGEDVDQSNNPMSKSKTLIKVNLKLNSLGYNTLD